MQDIITRAPAVRAADRGTKQALVDMHAALHDRTEATAARMIGYRQIDYRAARHILDAADRYTAHEYHGIDSAEVAARVLDNIAGALGRSDTRYTDLLLNVPAYRHAVTTRSADAIARRAGTGGGSMQYLGDDYERAASSLYSPWLSSYGDRVPEVGNTARAVGVAPGIPERDALGVSEPYPLAAHLLAAGIPLAAVALTYRAMDNVVLTSRGGLRVLWHNVAGSATTNAARRVRKSVRAALVNAGLEPRELTLTTPNANRAPIVRLGFGGAVGATYDVSPRRVTYTREWFTPRGAASWDSRGIAPTSPSTGTCCAAHADVERANTRRAVVGRPPLTTTRCDS